MKMSLLKNMATSTTFLLGGAKKVTFMNPSQRMISNYWAIPLNTKGAPSVAKLKVECGWHPTSYGRTKDDGWHPMQSQAKGRVDNLALAIWAEAIYGPAHGVDGRTKEPTQARGSSMKMAQGYEEKLATFKIVSLTKSDVKINHDDKY